jgi:hypothetical protein
VAERALASPATQEDKNSNTTPFHCIFCAQDPPSDWAVCCEKPLGALADPMHLPPEMRPVDATNPHPLTSSPGRSASATLRPVMLDAGDLLEVRLPLAPAFFVACMLGRGLHRLSAMLWARVMSPLTRRVSLGQSRQADLPCRLCSNSPEFALVLRGPYVWSRSNRQREQIIIILSFACSHMTYCLFLSRVCRKIAGLAENNARMIWLDRVITAGRYMGTSWRGTYYSTAVTLIPQGF